jgi:tetratricopeptide (TPR) repeat protein
MPRDSDQFDFFVSYARNDNARGWITRFIEELLEEHRKFTGSDLTRELKPFFDKHDIRSLDDWQHRIQDGLAKSRLLLAFISPNYFASEWCRREWKSWTDTEIAKHILSAGAAPIYFVEVPGFVGKVPGLAEQATLSEQQVASKIAELCGLPKPYDGFAAAVAPVVRQMRDRRQITSDFVMPFHDKGVEALWRTSLHAALERLAQDLDQRVQDVKRSAESETTVPPYNKKFSGRLDELLVLRDRLKDDRAGVISGVHGLGGIGKTELALAYAHAYASAYPGGRFLIRCEGKSTLRDTVMGQSDFTAMFRERISDGERKQPDTYFAAVAACLRERLARLGHVLLVLDNVSDLALLGPEQTDTLTVLGPKLHLLATTRLVPPTAGKGNWLSLGRLPEDDALDLLEKYRPFGCNAERDAARRIVKRLGGFTLVVELVAAWLAKHREATCIGFLERLGVEDIETLEVLAEEKDVKLRRHNDERRLTAVLDPTLAGLVPSEKRTMEYAALLSPDLVPLPWLRSLVGRDFPEITQRPRPGHADPWQALVDHLTGLTLFIRPDTESSEPRLLTIHRVIQDRVRCQMTPADLAERQAAVVVLAFARSEELEKHWHEPDWQWEIAPLVALTDQLLDRADKEAPRLVKWISQWLALFDTSSQPERLLRRSLIQQEADLNTEPTETAITLSNLGLVLYARGRLEEVERLMRKALAIDEEHREPTHEFIAIRLNNLALLLQATNRLVEAEPLLWRALAIHEKSNTPDHPKVASVLNNLALLLKTTNRLGEAEPLLRRALAIVETRYGPDHPAVARCLNNLAAFLEDSNRLTDAESLYRRALAIVEQSFGLHHPEVATRLNNLAHLLNDTNRLADAEPLMRRALAIDEQNFGPHHPNVANDLSNLAGMLHNTNRLAEAQPLMRRAVKILQKFTEATGHPHPLLQAAVDSYTGLLRAAGRTSDQILAALQELAPELYSTASADQLESAIDLNNRALELRKAGKIAEAEPLLRRALELDDKTRGGTHPKIPHRLNNLCTVLIMQGKLEESKPLLSRAWQIKSGQHDLTSARVLFIRLALAFLKSQPTETFIGQLKTILVQESLTDHANVAKIWDISCFIEHLGNSGLGIPDFEFLRALVAAFNDRARLPALDRFPTWKNQVPVPLDVPWPDSK